MAIPQNAMEQLGSTSAIDRKPCSACSYSKEWSSATARSNFVCVAGSTETGKCTVPSLSGDAASWPWPSSAEARDERESADSAARTRTSRFIHVSVLGGEPVRRPSRGAANAERVEDRLRRANAPEPREDR